MMKADGKSRPRGRGRPDHRTRMGLLAAVLLAASAPGISPARAQDDAAASPGPSTEPVGWLGAATEVYREPFEEAAAWIDLGGDEQGRTAVEDGALFMSIVGEDVNYRDWLVLAAPVGVLRVEALVDIDEGVGTGAGTACGSATGLPRWLMAGVNNADEWFLARNIDGRFTLVDRGPLMLPTSSSQGPVRVGIECAIVPEEGGDYVAVSVDGRPVSVGTGLGRLDIPVGPYDKAALFVATDTGTGSALFDDMTVLVGPAFAPRPAERGADRPSE